MQFLRRKNTIKWIALALTTLVVLALQGTPFLFPAVYGARPVLAVPLVVAVALCEGEVGGGAVGVAAGLLWDLSGLAVFGFHGFFLMFIGLAVGLLVRTVFHPSVLPALLLSLCAVFLMELISWFFLDYMTGGQDFVRSFFNTILPTAVYTFAFVVPFFFWVRFLQKKTQE